MRGEEGGCVVGKEGYWLREGGGGEGGEGEGGGEGRLVER